MVVAARAAHGQPQPHLRRGLDAVRRVDGQVLLGNRASLVGAHAGADEAGGDPLVAGGLRQQVSGNLLAREPIERLVAVEGADHPVAVGPDAAVVVEVIAVGVRVADGIEPVSRAMLAVARTGQQPIDQVLVGFRRVVSDERRNIFGRGGQAGQVEGDAADQGVAIGLRIGSQSLLFQPRDDESIDRVRKPITFAHLGQRRALGLDERPMRLVLRPFPDPALEKRLLARPQSLVRLRRRHDLFRVGRGDAPNQRALLGLPLDDDRLSVGAGRERELRTIKAKLCLPRSRVGAVAAEAVADEDRPDVLVEGDGRREDHARGRLGRRFRSPARDVRRRGGDEGHGQDGREQQSRRPRGSHDRPSKDSPPGGGRAKVSGRDLQLRAGLAQGREPRLGHPGASQVESSQGSEFLKRRQARVGHGRSVEAEAFELVQKWSERPHAVVPDGRPP